MSAASSSRCSGVSEASSRSVAAARRASESTSSSRLRGLSGKNSPYSSMNWSKSSCVCSPRASLSSMSLSADIMSLTRCIAAGSGLVMACFMPRNCASSTSRRSRSFSSSKVCRASGDATRTTTGVVRPARCRPAACRARPRAAARRRSGRGTARRVPGRSPGRAARAPPPACRRDAPGRAAPAAGRVPAAAGRRGPRRPSRRGSPRRSSSRSASVGPVPSSMESPMASRAARMSYGGARGSGPS